MTPGYATQIVNDLAAMAGLLAHDYPTLQRRLILWARDGYPTGAAGHVGRGAISDPTANAVLTPDPVRIDRNRLADIVARVHELLREANSIRTQYMSAPIDAERHNAALEKCANVHGCPDGMWAAKAGRCLACYEHRRTRHTDRPRKEVR